MSTIAVLRRADRQREEPAAPWDLDPALLESLREIIADAASAGTGARLVMALPQGALNTLVGARCGQHSWRTLAQAVVERGEVMAAAGVVAAPVHGVQGVRGALLLHDEAIDRRCEHLARALAARVDLALHTSVARIAAGHSTAEALLQTLAAYDRDTAHHAVAVRRMALALGKEVGLTPHGLLVLERAALLHDLGKIGVPQPVLAKSGPLDSAEWAHMRQHSAIGEQIVRAIPDLTGAAPAIRHHHERWDGTGYPDRLSGEAIPLDARIIALVDAYEAMRIGRPYREARSREDTLLDLANAAGSQFDPTVLTAFVDIPLHVLGL